jgi:hypothetical protein
MSNSRTAKTVRTPATALPPRRLPLALCIGQTLVEGSERYGDAGAPPLLPL